MGRDGIEASRETAKRVKTAFSGPRLSAIANLALLRKRNVPRETIPFYLEVLGAIDLKTPKIPSKARILFFGNRDGSGSRAVIAKLSERSQLPVDNLFMNPGGIRNTTRFISASTDVFDLIVVSPCYLREQVYAELDRGRVTGNVSLRIEDKEASVGLLLNSLYDRLHPGGAMLVFEPDDFVRLSDIGFGKRKVKMSVEQRDGGTIAKAVIKKTV